jgi:hypothetical protein
VYISQDGDDGDSEAVAHTARRYALQHDMVHLQVAPSAWSSSPQRSARAPRGTHRPSAVAPFSAAGAAWPSAAPAHGATSAEDLERRLHRRALQVGDGAGRSLTRWPGPGADVAAASPVPVQMWQRRARSRCRCGQGWAPSRRALRRRLARRLRDDPLVSSGALPFARPHVCPHVCPRSAAPALGRLHMARPKLREAKGNFPSGCSRGYSPRSKANRR